MKPFPPQFRDRRYGQAVFLTTLFGLASLSVVILANRYFSLRYLFGPSTFQIILMKLQGWYEGKVVTSKSPGKSHKGQVLMASPWQRNNTRMLICYKLEMLTIKAGVLFIAKKQGNIYSTKKSNMTLQQCSP